MRRPSRPHHPIAREFFRNLAVVTVHIWAKLQNKFENFRYRLFFFISVADRFKKKYGLMFIFKFLNSKKPNRIFSCWIWVRRRNPVMPVDKKWFRRVKEFLSSILNFNLMPFSMFWLCLSSVLVLILPADIDLTANPFCGYWLCLSSLIFMSFLSQSRIEFHKLKHQKQRWVDMF